MDKKSEFEKRYPDYSGTTREGVAVGVWKETASNGKEYLAIKIGDNEGVTAFKN